MRAFDLREILEQLCDRGHGDFEVVISREEEMEHISTNAVSSEIDLKKIKIYTGKRNSYKTDMKLGKIKKSEPKKNIFSKFSKHQNRMDMDLKKYKKPESKGILEAGEEEKSGGKELLTAKKILVSLRPSERKALENLAEKAGLPLSTLVRQLLKTHKYI